mmetsp:Transcript_5560/g.15998  ORF Transcript_5560/g.15998 Transcript_5560/m.15998 type:complete len:107 (-) Transcript_5560:220-540(-)
MVEANCGISLGRQYEEYCESLIEILLDLWLLSSSGLHSRGCWSRDPFAGSGDPNIVHLVRVRRHFFASKGRETTTDDELYVQIMLSSQQRHTPAESFLQQLLPLLR